MTIVAKINNPRNVIIGDAPFCSEPGSDYEHRTTTMRRLRLKSFCSSSLLLFPTPEPMERTAFSLALGGREGRSLRGNSRLRLARCAAPGDGLGDEQGRAGPLEVLRSTATGCTGADAASSALLPVRFSSPTGSRIGRQFRGTAW
jgi:hypothetical protein